MNAKQAFEIADKAKEEAILEFRKIMDVLITKWIIEIDKQIVSQSKQRKFELYFDVGRELRLLNVDEDVALLCLDEIMAKLNSHYRGNGYISGTSSWNNFSVRWNLTKEEKKSSSF